MKMILAIVCGFLTIVDDVKPGATPIDALVSVREQIRAAQAGDPLRKVLVDADFGPALNAELVKFDNAHTVFWRGSETREEAIARAEAAVVRPRAAIGVPRPRNADFWRQGGLVMNTMKRTLQNLDLPGL